MCESLQIKNNHEDVLVNLGILHPTDSKELNCNSYIRPVQEIQIIYIGYCLIYYYSYILYIISNIQYLLLKLTACQLSCCSVVFILLIQRSCRHNRSRLTNQNQCSQTHLNQRTHLGPQTDESLIRLMKKTESLISKLSHTWTDANNKKSNLHSS